jgi:molecular chaperone DnaK
MGIVVKNSPYILGIDLGTSNSAVAVYRNGKASVLPIDGKNSCPSVVNVLSNGEIIVGQQARKRTLIDPDNTVSSVKRHMGTDWEKEFEGLPGKKYTPKDISAEILSKLVSGAQESSDDLKGTPRYAVICIPANFDDNQKTETKEAGDLANLEVLWLLEEPVAAALAYADGTNRDQTILVYDLGGGTFDVAILDVGAADDGPSNYKFLAKEGIQELGGDDFDMKLMEIVAAKFEETSGVDILDSKKDQGIRGRSVREAQQKLKDAAEQAKQELSEADEAEIAIPNLIKNESGELHSLEIEITREQFEEAIKDLILDSKKAVEAALTSAKMTIEDISRIILVGGSTRVPLVKTMLTEMFGKEPYRDDDPDTAIARGAAIYGASLGVPSDKLEETNETDDNKHDGGIQIANIVTHNLGIERVGGFFSCLLEKGMEISTDGPLRAEKIFATQRDNQADMRIVIYQADSNVDSVRNENVKCIGEFYLTGIPPKPRAQETVTVVFEMDQQNLLKVTATGSSSSGELEIEKL